MQVPSLCNTQVMCACGAILLNLTSALSSELSARNGGPEKWLGRYICASQEARHIQPLIEHGLTIEDLQHFSNEGQPAPVAGGPEWDKHCQVKRYMWSVSSAGASPCPNDAQYYMSNTAFATNTDYSQIIIWNVNEVTSAMKGDLGPINDGIDHLLELAWFPKDHVGLRG